MRWCFGCKTQRRCSRELAYWPRIHGLDAIKEIDYTVPSAAASMTHICSSVSSEGGVEELGVHRGLNRGTTAMSTSNDANKSYRRYVWMMLSNWR